jgi:polysaccharide pyruvyl transferase WcaK-like protein
VDDMAAQGAGRADGAGARVLRVGLFGRLGSGNIGNDCSMESVLNYLRADHPDAIIDAMCNGPERIYARYGIGSSPLFWYQRHSGRAGVAAIPLKAIGKVLDAGRIARWVRRHDVVIVPGMGVLEASLPLPPLEFPYCMFLLGISGRLFHTKVALVSVGADAIKQRVTRTLFDWAARLAFYRSYRNENSREAMRRRGVDVSGDRVFPDLAFSLPVVAGSAADPQTVAVGVMGYFGSDADRDRAQEINAVYMTGLKRFVRWLVDNDRNVRLIIGDTDGPDQAALQEILADLAASRPGLQPGRVIAAPVDEFTDVQRAIAPAHAVVATRFHNLVAALMLTKPTVAISYSAKHDALMADMGLREFSVSASSFDADELIDKFVRAESRAGELRQVLLERTTANAALLDEQYALLSELLFPARAERSSLASARN